MEDKSQYVEILNFNKGETIFREGNPGGCMYEVQAGRVGIVANYGTENVTVLTELREGAFFGEMGMVRGFPRSATAVALDHRTSVSVITWDTMGFYFKDSPSKVVGIMQQMSTRINELSDDYLDACGAVTELLERQDKNGGLNLKDERFKKYLEAYRRYQRFRK